jgi:hypothetical protein
MPHLFRSLYAPEVKSSHVVTDVLGLESSVMEELTMTISRSCGATNIMVMDWRQGVNAAAYEAAKAGGLKFVVFDDLRSPRLSEMRGERDMMVRDNGIDALCSGVGKRLI